MITQVWRGVDEGPMYLIIFTRDDRSWDADKAVFDYLVGRFGLAGWIMTSNKVSLDALDCVVNDHNAEVVVLKNSPAQLRRAAEGN